MLDYTSRFIWYVDPSSSSLQSSMSQAVETKEANGKSSAVEIKEMNGKSPTRVTFSDTPTDVENSTVA